ncbi:chaplin [Streptacidiphilus sp. N1-3]|uniref:Chaplin n=1 Tax=Streptacidiphilus alkalitolerans TaxID=3342712 RepID=A0ABV6X6T4_9ACTN
MATGSVLASTAGYAYADAGAVGTAADSPGVGSGNTVQVPIDIPVNACGNTINVVGLLNPAMGNHCANVSQPSAGHGAGHGSGHDSGGPRHGSPYGGGPGAGSQGGSHGSPGVGSGNTAQVPVSVPVNLCGDSANVVGLGNPAFGNQCATHSGGKPSGHTPPEHCSCTHPQPPPPVAPPVRHNPPPPPVKTVTTHPKHMSPPPPPQEVLASTGADGETLLLAPAGAAMALGGLLLYRRSRTAQR